MFYSFIHLTYPTLDSSRNVLLNTLITVVTIMYHNKHAEINMTLHENPARIKNSAALW